MSFLNEYAKEIKTKIWKTKCSRFNASRRLEIQYMLSVTSISIISVLCIAISIVQNTLDLSACPNVDKFYSLVSILFSIFILILSLLEGSKNYQVKAERLHTNAVDISDVYEKITYIKKCKIDKEHKDKSNQIEKEINRICKEYNALIKSCPENHSSDDYLLMQAQHYKDFDFNFCHSLLIKTFLIIKYYWLYLLLCFFVVFTLFRLYFACPI